MSCATSVKYMYQSVDTWGWGREERSKYYMDNFILVTCCNNIWYILIYRIFFLISAVFLLLFLNTVTKRSQSSPRACIVLRLERAHTRDPSKLKPTPEKHITTEFRRTATVPSTQEALPLGTMKPHTQLGEY